MKWKENKILFFGEDFERKNNIKNNYYTEYKTLKECFNKWSERKQYIYNYYYELLIKNTDKIIDYGIRSNNSMIINLHAVVEKKGQLYYLLITPLHNYYVEY